MKQRSLRDLFHLVKQVLPEEQQLISVSSDTSVAEAFKIMGEHAFDQLPVLEGGEVIGVFSHRSFAEGLSRLPGKVREKVKDPLSLPVDEFIETLHFARITDELATLFDEFDAKSAVLVGSEDRLLGVADTAPDPLKKSVE